METRRGATIWRWWLLIGALAVGGYFLLPYDTWASGLFYDGVGAASATVIAVATRVRRPAYPRMWYLFSLGQMTWVVGDLTYDYYQYGLHHQPFPSPADVFYLAAYPLLLAGLGVLVRRRRGPRSPAGHDLAGLLDAAIVAVGVGLVLWTLLLRPIAADASLSGIAKACSLAYPFCDLAMLAVTARLLTKQGSRTASYRMLVAAVILLLVSDVAFSLFTTYSTYTGGIVDAGWLVSYVLWAAAVLHPSAVAPLSTDEIVAGHRRQTFRLVVLAVTVLVCPAALLVEGLTDPHTIDWLGIGVGAALLCVLVLFRALGLLTQIRAQAGELEHQATHDDLTGLANRRLLRQRLEACAGSPAQLVLIDLDDFKIVNDRLGHAVGDRLIAVVAERLHAQVSSRDTVARLGGDEFAVLLPGATDDETDALVERLLSALHQPVRTGDADILVRASAGAAGSGGSGGSAGSSRSGGPTGSADSGGPAGSAGSAGSGGGAQAHGTLLRRADLAMYAAKSAGTAYLRYHPELDERTGTELRLAAELREAFDHGDFHLLYQPIVSLPSGDLAGVEALVRWNRPGAGPADLGPADFIPVAERSGLIVELGEWILREACRQGAAWNAALGSAAPARVSVNVSPRQLREPGFAGTVADVLRTTGLPASHLVVEVTETAVFDSEPALRALNAVSALGVRVALDDFGTGHSSLGLLQTCPVDILKVDKSFIDDITAAGRPAVIARALINVSDGLNLTAIAEGVETAAQADRLLALGYHYAQGYHFGRPVPAADITAAVTSRAALVA